MYRRDLIGGAVVSVALAGRAFGQQAELIPWADQPPPVPAPLADNVVRGEIRWEDLAGSWITPADKFFGVAHYGYPTIDEKAWRLNVGGSVAQPTTLSLADLKAMPRQEVVSTLECSGNNGFPFISSMIGNAAWAGVSLAEVLRKAQIKDGAVEVVFYGVDSGEDVAHKGAPFEFKYTDTFARSMSIADAMSPANMLCYEMNGAALPTRNGFPVRLIAPGWFGIANVKWLSRIEVRDTRYLGRFMGREYVTMREQPQDGRTVMTATSVGRMLLKSAPARVMTTGGGKYQIEGMAWGPDVAAVEVQIDKNAWTKVPLETAKSAYTWRSWQLTQPLAPGDHTITSRAIDASGKVQPAMDDPSIANKRTYWESNGQITRTVRI
jgi:DMSO/TMAO reductase YedYZ molybdopterin-dependent catalytic subunit